MNDTSRSIPKPRRIAMWSGPRNISTAMMRSWGNRPDTAVVDEPFYAFFLNTTGADHPGVDEVIAAGETDWRRVVDQLTRDVPQTEDDARCAIFYQKQMTHHLLLEIDRSWLLRVTNCFLIRDPAEVIASYTKKNHEPALEEIGFLQQAEIFDFVRHATGETPPVIDARDVQDDPRRSLTLLCEAAGVPFSEAMLSWPAGRRASDGVWAKYWYAEVERSTAFQPHRHEPVAIPERLRAVYEAASEIYQRLRTHRLH